MAKIYTLFNADTKRVLKVADTKKEIIDYAKTLSEKEKKGLAIAVSFIKEFKLREAVK